MPIAKCDLDPLDAFLAELMPDTSFDGDIECCDKPEVVCATPEDGSWCPSEKYLKLTGSQLSQLYHLTKIILDAQTKTVLLSTVSDLLFNVYQTKSEWPPFEQIISMAVDQGAVSVEGDDDSAVISLVDDAISEKDTNSSIDVKESKHSHVDVPPPNEHVVSLQDDQSLRLNTSSSHLSRPF